MRIGIYVETAKDPKPTGIGLHVRNLVDALAGLDETNEYLLYYQRNLLGPAPVFPGPPTRPNFRLRPVRCQPLDQHPRLWWNWILPRALRKDRVDLFHGPNHLLADFPRRPQIVTIHDLAYFHMRVHGETQNEALVKWTNIALGRASAVIALSQNTRRDLEGLGVSPGKIRVIYGGGHIVPESQIQYRRRDELNQALKLPEKYILFVGTLQPRKNVPFLLRAYAKLKEQGIRSHKLVLAGHRDAAAEEIDRLINTLGIAGDVTITGYVESWQLPLLYKQADLFVLPTLYEGFTLVTLEAMAYGVPLIATDTSSIREGVGDAGLLVPVNDDSALANAMAKALTDIPIRNGLIAAGTAQAQRFTWEQCARDTLNLYHTVIEKARTPVMV